MLVHILILNYNGRPLLEDCLPSVMAAAAGSRHQCTVGVVDNDSTDDSVAWLCAHWPDVYVVPHANRGLCSFNDVVPWLPGRVAILLNNDVKLAADAIDPLVAPLVEPIAAAKIGVEDPCFMTAARCLNFDSSRYEGQKTAAAWRWGLVQATSLFAGHESVIPQPDLTASAGAAIAVDRDVFAQLDGFDPLYLPGRLEDLDFAFRGYQAGYCAHYVPAAVVWHLGMGTFGPLFGAATCNHLALRNTLLFQWKNLQHPRHRLRHWSGLALRLAVEAACAAWLPTERRWATWRAVREAWKRRRAVRPSTLRSAAQPAKAAGFLQREVQFFRRFDPRQLARPHFATLAGAASAGATPAARFGAGLLTPPEPPTAGLPEAGRPAVDGVARSETGHNGAPPSVATRWDQPWILDARRRAVAAEEQPV